MSGNLGETTTHESPKVVGVVGGLFVASVTDTLTLDGTHGDHLVLTPTAARTVLLQPEATRRGVTVQISNAGAFALTVKEDSGTTTIGTVAAGQVGWFTCDGTTWTATGAATGPGTIFMSAELTGTGSAQTIPHGRTGTPSAIWWSVGRGHDGAGAVGDLVPVIGPTGFPDGTNLYMSCTAGAKYTVLCSL